MICAYDLKMKQSTTEFAENAEVKKGGLAKEGRTLRVDHYPTFFAGHGEFSYDK